MRHFKDLPQSTGHSMTYAGIGNRDLDGVTDTDIEFPKGKLPSVPARFLWHR